MNGDDISTKILVIFPSSFISYKNRFVIVLVIFELDNNKFHVQQHSWDKNRFSQFIASNCALRIPHVAITTPAIVKPVIKEFVRW